VVRRVSRNLGGFESAAVGRVGGVSSLKAPAPLVPKLKAQGVAMQPSRPRTHGAVSMRNAHAFALRGTLSDGMLEPGVGRGPRRRTSSATACSSKGLAIGAAPSPQYKHQPATQPMHLGQVRDAQHLARRRRRRVPAAAADRAAAGRAHPPQQAADVRPQAAAHAAVELVQHEDRRGAFCAE
jgi:hypothetical protein